MEPKAHTIRSSPKKQDQKHLRSIMEMTALLCQWYDIEVEFDHSNTEARKNTLQHRYYVREIRWGDTVRDETMKRLLQEYNQFAGRDDTDYYRTLVLDLNIQYNVLFDGYTGECDERTMMSMRLKLKDRAKLLNTLVMHVLRLLLVINGIDIPVRMTKTCKVYVLTSFHVALDSLTVGVPIRNIDQWYHQLELYDHIHTSNEHFILSRYTLFDHPEQVHTRHVSDGEHIHYRVEGKKLVDTVVDQLKPVLWK